jgi:hypothetical protein
MMFGTFYGFIHGDVTKLLAPMDGAGNFCGSSKGFKDFPNLYISNLIGDNINDIFKSGVCVKHCPTESGGEITIDC